MGRRWDVSVRNLLLHRYRESYVLFEAVGFRGFMREMGCARVAGYVRRGEIEVGVGNSLISGYNFCVDV